MTDTVTLSKDDHGALEFAARDAITLGAHVDAEIDRLAKLIGETTLVTFARKTPLTAEDKLSLLKALQVKWDQKLPPRGRGELSFGQDAPDPSTAELFSKLQMSDAEIRRAQETTNGNR